MSTPSALYRASLRSLQLFVAGLALPLAAVAQTATVGVNATQTVRTVDERVFGLNAVMWDGQTSSSQTISMLQAAGVRAIRVPGGSASDSYTWRTNKSDGQTSTANAGFDSFSRLITGINAQAFVTVNYGSGTRQEAAAWVAYANASATLLGTGGDTAIGSDGTFDWKTAGYWSNLRASGPLGQDDGSNFLRVSRSAPIGIKYWEIGNECYGSWENDTHATKWDPVTYATVAKDCIAAMKAVDPTIKIGVVAETGEDSLDSKSPVHFVMNPRTGISHRGWTPVMLATLKTLGVTPDFLIYHRYDGAPGQESDATLLQAAKTWPNDAANLRQMLNDYLGSDTAAGVELCVTENNSVYSNPGRQTTSLVNGLYLADSIGNVLQTEFNSLVWWDLRNGQDTSNNLSATLYGWRLYGDYGVMSSNFVTGSSTLYDAYPTYFVMKLLSNFARGGDTVVAATSNNTLLSIFAAKHSDGTLRLLVINKSSASTITGNIALTGFTPTATATVYSYGMPQDNAAHAGTGSLDVASTSASIAGASFSLQFAPYSVSVVVLSDANQVQVLNSISYNSTTFPATALPGANVSFTCNVTNTGTNAWGANHYLVMRDANNVNLAYASLNGVNPGASTTATLDFTAPSTPGHYTYYVQGLENYVAYFSARATLEIAVGSVAGDFNGDGHADLLWQDAATGARTIWLMDDGAFLGGVPLVTLSTDWSIAGVGDFNGDGQPDLVWQNTVTGDRSIWLMNGTSFLGGVSLGTVSTDWSIAAVGDFNGDGKPDLVWQNTVTGERTIWLMDGASFLGGASLGTVPTNWSIAGTGDFDGDGQTDLLWQNLVTGDVSLWLMNGTGFLSGLSLGSAGPQMQIAGIFDYNGDGQPDILWTNTATGERLVWIMSGTTVASTATITTLPLEWVLNHPVPRGGTVNADFNGDGHTDLLFQNTATGERTIWLMNGTSFLSGVSLVTLSTDWSVGGVGDFNGDGKVDLAWQNTATGERSLWFLDGTSFLGGAALGTVSTDWSIAGTGDFNGDGKSDLIWQNTATGDRTIWLMDGGTFVGGAYLGVVPTDWSITGTGDFNGDGKPDLIWQNTATGERVVWLMDGTAFVSGVSLGTEPTDWSIAGSGDFNGDGKSDLIWQNTATGERTIWLMDGTTFLSGVSLGVVPTVWSIRD